MHAHTQADVVLLLSSCSFHSVLSRLPANCISQDAFFYSLVYDPQQKTLLADKGEIRVGNKFQADITDLLKEGMLGVLNDGVCLRGSGYFLRCLQGYLLSISLFTDYWPIKNYSSEHVSN